VFDARPPGARLFREKPHRLVERRAETFFAGLRATLDEIVRLAMSSTSHPRRDADG